MSIFALLAIVTFFSGQISAQQTCTPTTTVTEGDLAPGGTVSFAVTSGPGSVTIDHVNAGTGLQSLTLVNAPTNATVNIPSFTPGTFNPVTVTFNANNSNQPVDFTLRAASSFHSAFIRVRCGGINPTPTPTATPTPNITPTPTPSVTPTPAMTPTPTATPTPTPPPGNLTSFTGRATTINATINGETRIVNDTGELPSRGGFLTNSGLSAVLFQNSLITGALDATSQAAFDQSRASAAVYDLVFTLNGNVFTSVIAAQSAQATCTGPNRPPVTDGAFFGNLVMNGTVIPVTGEISQRVNLPNGAYVIINEQIRTGSGNFAELRANGLHFVSPGQADVILSSTKAGIFCGSNVRPEFEDEKENY